MRDFQVVPEGNKLVVSMRDSSTAQSLRRCPRRKKQLSTADATQRLPAPLHPCQPVAAGKAEEKDRGSHALPG